MSILRQKILGWSLAIAGLLIATFSRKIVSPGLERLIGPERIVGHENVLYLPGGGYLLTNPGAMVRWIGAIVAFGLFVAVVGAIMLWRARQSAPATIHQQQNQSQPMKGAS